LGRGAFVLGAIVSPTDPVAPTVSLRQLEAPRRLLTIIEGENLTNGWTALTLYQFAVAAVVTGSFSLWEASGQFVLTGLGGVAVGLIAGRVIREVRRRIEDPLSRSQSRCSRLEDYRAEHFGSLLCCSATEKMLVSAHSLTHGLHN